MRRYLLVLIAISIGGVAQAQLVEQRFDGTSKKVTPASAQEEIYNQAIEATTLSLLEAEIGAAAVKANRQIIENQIIASHARFIPFVKADNLAGDSGNYKMTVRLRVSMSDLKALIRENNLIASNAGLPLMLPMIRFVDRIGDKTYSWWTASHGESSNLLQQWADGLEEALAENMSTAHFYAYKPKGLGLRPMVPQAYRIENPRLEDSLVVGRYFNARMLMSGDVQLRRVEGRSRGPAELHVRWSGVNTANGRSVADLNRTFLLGDSSNEVEMMEKVSGILAKLSADFVSQVELGWERGTLDTSVIRIVVNGHLPVTSHQEFRKAIMAKSNSIKDLKERILSESQTIFEADVSSSAEVLSRELGNLNFKGHQLSLDNVNAAEKVLTFRIHR